MNIYVLNTTGLGEDTIDLVSQELNIKGVIGLSKRENTDAISDYSYQGSFCKKTGIEFIEIETYNMSSEKDKLKLLNLDIDVIVIGGWQRLIPGWLIKHCSICAIGSHGSPLGITKGRGRSPQNWALIMGLDTFEISIFQIDKGIDSGRVFTSKKFEYSLFDDIKTSYYKVCLLTSQMIINLLKDPNFIKKKYLMQEESEAEYFPQRKAEDGRIDWNRSNNEIKNLIRGLTRPYPGATTACNGNIIRVWDGIPFTVDIPMEKYRVGEIVKIFNKKDVLVRTKDSFFMLTDYFIEADGFKFKNGLVLESVNFNDQMSIIINRHENKYEDLPISTLLKTFAKK